VLLYFTYKLFETPVVLKVLAAAVAIGAAAIFLFRAPFLRWQKVLFLAGVYPLYEYSVMARNYGIGMLALFAACTAYPRRFEKSWLYGGFVFLLSGGGRVLPAAYHRHPRTYPARDRARALAGLGPGP
jgi:hypothetical protein